MSQNTIIRMKLKISIIVVICLVTIKPAKAQMLSDTASLRVLHSCIDNIYNMRISEAEGFYRVLFQKWPGHPARYLLKGMMTYWSSYPLTTLSPSRVNFEKDMRRCIELCENSEKKESEEYLLTNLCARGFLLLFYSDNDLNKDVFPLALNSYGYIRRSFETSDAIPDFNFFKGMYNYYREAYPRAYPIYKPLAFLLPRGNIEVGLEELQTASKKSIVLKAETLSFLSYIYLTFEDNFQKAAGFSKTLYMLYPSNLEYRADYIKNLLLIKQYDEAERLISLASGKISNSFFNAELMILKGILKEKKYQDLDAADELYKEGLKEISFYSLAGNEYASYALFGLSRISGANYDIESQNRYRKRALELSDFKKLNFD